MDAKHGLAASKCCVAGTFRFEKQFGVCYLTKWYNIYIIYLLYIIPWKFDKTDVIHTFVWHSTAPLWLVYPRPYMIGKVKSESRKSAIKAFGGPLLNDVLDPYRFVSNYFKIWSILSWSDPFPSFGRLYKTCSFCLMALQGTASSFLCDLTGSFAGNAPSCSPKSVLAKAMAWRHGVTVWFLVLLDIN